MKVIIAAVLAVTLIGSGSNVLAGKPHSGKGMGKILKDAELALSEEQLASIKGIRQVHKAQKESLGLTEPVQKISDLDKNAADYADQVAALKAERAARKDLVVGQREVLNEEIIAILSSDQQERFEVLLAERKSKNNHKHDE